MIGIACFSRTTWVSARRLQAVVAFRILRAKGDAGRCLVIAPASVLEHWRREFGKWAPEVRTLQVRGAANDRDWQWRADIDAFLVSYDTLRIDLRRSEFVRRRTWDVVIADEAQRIKNRNVTSFAIKGVLRSRSWALTGTPLENREAELASVIECVDDDLPGYPTRQVPGPALRAVHRELQLRRKKADVLEQLPPKQVTKLGIDLTPGQRESYERAERKGIVFLKSLGKDVRITHVLALITRLKQICNADPESGDSSKLDDIRDRMEQLVAEGHKALVFSQFTDATFGVAAVERHLRQFNPLCITGTTAQEDRAGVVDRFKSDRACPVLVLSLRVGSLGLNLQEASYVFHLDRWWNPAVERQAEDRSHRHGQTVKVNVVKYSCVGTIEDRIDEILEEKQLLFDEIVDDVSIDVSARLSLEELLSLFNLQR